MQTSTSDGNRIATRYGSEMVDAIILLTLILPGSVIIQQGDELGVADTILDWTNTTNCWPMNYIPSAAPFPWDNSPKANFTTGEPWMPLPPNYRYKNAKSEYGNELSHVSVMKIASAMRKSAAIGPHVEVKLHLFTLPRNSKITEIIEIKSCTMCVGLKIIFQNFLFSDKSIKRCASDIAVGWERITFSRI